MTPALAKLVSLATPAWRSNTVTSWPSRASSNALVTPTMPAPMMAMRTLQCPGAASSRSIASDTSSTVSSHIEGAQTIRPTGSSSAAWQGSDSAQPSR